MSSSLRYSCVILLSLLSHLYGLRSPLLDYHHHRQVNTAAIARNYHENGLRFFHPQIHWEGDYQGRAATEFPLYMYLIGLLWNLFGLGDIWGRLLSVGFSALTAATLMRFLENWIPFKAAFFAGLLFSVLPVEVYFGRTVQPEAMALFCTLLCLFALDLYLSRPRYRFAYWLLAGLAGSLAIGHKLPYIYLLGVCAALAWSRQGLRDIGLWAFFPMVCIAVFAWYKYASFASAYVVPTKKWEFLTLLNYAQLAYYTQYQFLSRFPELTVTWPGLALWVAGAFALKSQKRETWFFLWAYFACVGLYVTAGGLYTFVHEYSALPFAPINAAFMGLGLDFLLRQLQERGRSYSHGALLAVVVFSIPLYTFFRIKHWYRISYPYLLNAKTPVDQISSPQNLFLCNDRTGSAYLYYIHRRGWGQSLEEQGNKSFEWVREKIRQGAKFYLTQKAGPFLDPSHPLSKPFYAQFPIAYDGDGILIFRLK